MQSLNKRISELEKALQVAVTPQAPASNANGAAKILVNLSMKQVEDRITEMLNEFIVKIGPTFKTLFEIVKAAVEFVEEIAPVVTQLLIIAPGIFTGQTKLNTALFLIQEVAKDFYEQVGQIHIIDMIEGILGIQKKNVPRTKSTTSDVVEPSPEPLKKTKFFKSR